MTAEQAAANEAAQEVLVRGKYYRFDPPVTAGAIPTRGPNVCAVETCTFDRGCYIGFVDHCHVFQGKPVNDQRLIAVPQGHQNSEKNREELRDSYFHVLFIGGSTAVPDSD